MIDLVGSIEQASVPSFGGVQLPPPPSSVSRPLAAYEWSDIDSLLPKGRYGSDTPELFTKQYFVGLGVGLLLGALAMHFWMANPYDE